MAVNMTPRPLPSTMTPRSEFAKSKGFWSVSYRETARSMMSEQETTALSSTTQSFGTATSESFFKKMGTSLAEAERLRQQCRSAAATSAAGGHEERPNLDHFNKSVRAAQAMASFASRLEKDTKGNVIDRNDAPTYLGHLTVPAPMLEGHDLPAYTVKAPRAASPHEEDSADALSRMMRTPHKEGAHTEAAVQRMHTPPHKVRQAESPVAQRSLTNQPTAENPAATSSERTPREGHLDMIDRSPHSRRDSGGSLGDTSEMMSSDEESGVSDKWPPKPPLLRFKMRVQFSQRFKPPDKTLFSQHNEDVQRDKLISPKVVELKDMTIGWLNNFFELAVATDFEYEVGFPIVMLFIMDAIYPTRVRWHEVDWRLQYRRALQKNYGLLAKIWSDVNMEKAREFRYEATHIRLENMPSAKLQDKLEFLRLMKRWFDVRIHHADPYNPLHRRHEFVEKCKKMGHEIKFPAWVKYDKDDPPKIPERDVRDYDKMSEFKRLIYFLGSPEYQTM